MPEGGITYGDKPDVTVFGERRIGIEITRFFLQPGSLLGSKQRQRPLRAAVVSQAQALYRRNGGKAIELTIGFDGGNPIIVVRMRQLPGELAALASRIDNRRTSGEVERSLFRTIPEISFMHLNAREYPDALWRVIGTDNIGLMSSTKLEGIVRQKESRCAEYRRCDAYWLLVIVEPMDSAQEQKIAIDGLNIASEVFERIIVYKPGFEHIVEAKLI